MIKQCITWLISRTGVERKYCERHWIRRVRVVGVVRVCACGCACVRICVRVVYVCDVERALAGTSYSRMTALWLSVTYRPV